MRLGTGLRVNSPNLEQCDLLRIEYTALGELCADESVWSSKHASLRGASLETRKAACEVLLDYMRRGLAINVECLEPDYGGEVIRRQSVQNLIEPWAIDEGGEK